MRQPSCEDLRIGKTIEGFQIHSPLGQGPFFRVYGADKGDEEWRVYAWEGAPPSDEALSRFGAQVEKLSSLQDPSLIPVRGPFSFPDGAVGWAVQHPAARDVRGLVEAGSAKASLVTSAFSAIAKTLAAAASAGVLHPGLSPDTLFVRQTAPFGLVSGFFSWRKIYPPLVAQIGPEAESPFEAPEEEKTEASLVYSLGKISEALGVSIQEATSEDPKKRPTLSALAQAYSSQRPGFWGRLFGK